MGKIREEPKGPAAMVPKAWSSPLKSGMAPVGTSGWVGRKGARCPCASHTCQPKILSLDTISLH